MADNFKLDIKVELPAGAAEQLQKASAQALKRVAAELDGRFTDAISKRNWAWPRKSKRGVQGITLSETAKKWRAAKFNTGSPRSIVDSGDLKASKAFSLQANRADWIWSTEYAAAVHDGAYIQPWANQKAAKRWLPPRPWTTAVLQGAPTYKGEIYDFATRYADELRKLLG